MDTKLFRNFTTYVNRADKQIDIAAFEHMHGYAASDPGLTQWVNGGFLPITDGEEPEYVIDIQGAALLCALQFNERILPGAVQREKIAERIADIERRDGRKASKKDYAQVKDEICLELLPKAFIRRTLIPIMIVTVPGVGQVALVFTSSAKKADDTMLALSATLSDALAAKYEKFWNPSLFSNIARHVPGSVLTNMARGETVDMEDNENVYLQFFNSATLKGANKQTITIKEKDIGSADVQNLLKQEYAVTKLGIEFYDDDLDPACTAVVSEKLIVSGLKVDAVSKERVDSEADSTAMFINNTWLIASVCKRLVALLVTGMGGFNERAEPAPGIGSQDAQQKNLATNSCRADGRCQYAIDCGAEGDGAHCPPGKCVMPEGKTFEDSEL